MNTEHRQDFDQVKSVPWISWKVIKEWKLGKEEKTLLYSIILIHSKHYHRTCNQSPNTCNGAWFWEFCLIRVLNITSCWFFFRLWCNQILLVFPVLVFNIISFSSVTVKYHQFFSVNYSQLSSVFSRWPKSTISAVCLI